MIEAAASIGLHICGVDVIAESMLKPLEAQGGGIVDVGKRIGSVGPLHLGHADCFGRAP